MLLHSRRLVLEHAGFRVESCHADEALAKLRENRDQFDGALLGQSIAVDDRLALAQEMREIAPDLAIIVLYFPEDRFDASVCDAVVETLSEPQVLARAVQRALRKRGKS